MRADIAAHEEQGVLRIAALEINREDEDEAEQVYIITMPTGYRSKMSRKAIRLRGDSGKVEAQAGLETDDEEQDDKEYEYEESSESSEPEPSLSDEETAAEGKPAKGKGKAIIKPRPAKLDGIVKVSMHHRYLLHPRDPQKVSCRR